MDMPKTGEEIREQNIKNMLKRVDRERSATLQRVKRDLESLQDTGCITDREEVYTAYGKLRKKLYPSFDTP